MSEVARAVRIEELRERIRPETFDGWLCLGGNYRDLAEAQEWASHEEIEKLSVAFNDYRNKVGLRGKVEEPEPWEECYWCEETKGVSLAKSCQLYGCPECVAEIS